MSRNTEITIISGTDCLSFDTGTRDLAEALNIPLRSERIYKGGDAVALLNGSVEWFRNVSDHYRKITMLLTDPQRLWYSTELNRIISVPDGRSVAERYAELEKDSALKITIAYRD